MSTALREPAVCDFCGLPLPRAWTSASTTPDRLAVAAPPEPVYCCFGCRFAARVAGDRSPEAQTNWTLARLALGIFLSMNVMVFTMFLWSWDIYGAPAEEAARIANPLADLFRLLCLMLTVPVLWALGFPLAENTWRALRSGNITTDLLLVLGVAAAFGYSAWSVWQGAGHVYFEVACMVLVFVTLGRWFEATGRVRTTAALDALERLLPTDMLLVTQDAERRVPLNSIQTGDVVRVLAGERMGVDGRIQSGVASVDEHLLTGESQPAVKEPGDPVWGGSLNMDGDLRIIVVAPARQGALQRMINAVQHARAAKGRYERLADRVAIWFTPAMIAVALGTFAWRLTTSGFETGLLSALAVVLIACPCALGLATPLAVWTALGAAARRQVLFRSGDALEQLASVRGLCIDKTGTLSTAEPELAHSEWDDESAVESMQHGALLAAEASTHPLATALRRSLAINPTNTSPPQGIAWTTYPGRGIVGRIDRDACSADELCLGSARLLRERGVEISARLQQAGSDASAAGRSTMWFSTRGRARAVFAFEEQLRDQVAEALADCRRAGLALRILTGDHAQRAAVVARKLGVEVRAELLPDEKLAAIREAQATWGHVAMVGDGINDAPALAAADVGIALGCGVDVTRDSADVCLLGNDLRSVAWSVQLARRTVQTIRQNLFWAFAYNTLGVALAASGQLNPLWAAGAMVASSVLVIVNSLRLASDDTNSSAPPAPLKHVASRTALDAQPPAVAEECAA